MSLNPSSTGRDDRRGAKALRRASQQQPLDPRETAAAPTASSDPAAGRRAASGESRADSVKRRAEASKDDSVLESIGKAISGPLRDEADKDLDKNAG